MTGYVALALAPIVAGFVLGFVLGYLLESRRRPEQAVGRCGDALPRLFDGDFELLICALPHGHRGWHQSDDARTGWAARP